MLVWCFQFRSKDQLERYLHADDGKTPPVDKAPLPSRFHANGKATEPMIPKIQENGDGEVKIKRPKTFSFAEEEVMQVASHEWQYADDLACASGGEVTSKCRSTLRSLVERGFLEGGQRGYRIPPHIDIDRYLEE